MPEDTAVGIPTDNRSNPLPPAVAQERANKTQRSLGASVPKSTEELYRDFLDGKEADIRRQAVSDQNYKKALERQQQIQDLAVKQQGPLSAEQVLKIMDPFSPANKPADVDTVIEKAYADKTLSTLSTAVGYMQDNIVNAAKVEIPQQVEETLLEGSELLTKNQYIRTRMQNAQTNLVGEQTNIGYALDFAKTMFQPYVEYTQRGHVPDAEFSLGLGSALDAQHYALYRKPMGEFKSTFDKAMDYLEAKNPQLAVQYAQSLLSQNTFQNAVNNTFTAIQVPDYLAATKIGAAVIKKATHYNQVRKAAGDIVEAAARNPDATSATAAEGAGDIRTAVVERMATQIEQALAGNTGDPLQVARDTLLTTWREDAEKFTQNQGTFLSRELLTRIQDGFVRDGEDLINRIVTMNRVERTPVAVTSRDVINAYIDRIKADFKGPANTLADVQGPIREPISGTYWYKSKIVNYDGLQFADQATAKGFADQLGIANPVIKGIESDKIYIPQAAMKNFESVQTVNGSTKVYVDNGIEVMASPSPQEGFVPYNTKTGKFEQALTKEQATIEQQGLGFHIEAWTPMREGDNLIRDLMIHTPSGSPIKDAISTNSASGINSIKNSLLGWVRNSDDTLSVNESAQRKAVTYTQSNIHKWAAELNKTLEDVASGRVREDPVTGEPLSRWTYLPKSFTSGKVTGRKIAQQFERTLDYARRATDPATGKDGYFFKTAGELQDHYLRNFQRDPSYLETKAYFNYTKLIEGDRMFGEIAEFRNRARLGTEQHTITLTDKKTNDKIKSKTFDGIIEKEFPGGDDYILVTGQFKGDERLEKLGEINTKKLNEMKAAVKEGRAKVIRIYDQNHMPLSDLSEHAQGKLISYVYTRNAESKPLSFNHVERRGGGHFEWDYDNYLKQADVKTQGREALYLGDITVMPIKNRKLGQNIAKLWNEAQDLIRQNKWDEVRPITAKMGINYQEFTSWYHPGRDAEGRPIPPRLNPDEPIVVVQKNKKISELGSELRDRYRILKPDGKYIETFRDTTRSGPANNFKVAYNTERHSDFEMRTVNDVGTKGNPIYAHQPADMIDPLTTMNRALNRAINTAFMDDYKLYAVEHWLREAEPHFNSNISKNEIRSSPFYYFNNPDWAPGVEKNIIWNLESNKFKIQQFVGTPNKFDTWVHSLTTHLADSFYTKHGPEEARSIGRKAVTVVPIWALHHVTDPVSWLRSVTFNFKLGLGAIPQFLVQAQTHSLIWALEPRHGTVGTYHTLLHGWSKFAGNDTVLNKLDDMATKLNMFGSKTRPGEWREARRELDKSGFENVAGEYSNLNDQLKTKFIMNDFDKGLRLGQYPFRLGEQSTRVTAWYTAFREFRDANPTIPITNIERSKILAKADLLTVNMSRASSSALNHGVFSLSTQFLTYQIKLAELFWGKRLGETTMERNLARARVIGMFSLLYGIPSSIGVTGAPVSDNLREHFMDDLGYIPGEKWYSTAVNEGIPAWSYAMITGTLPNVGDRFGSQGFQNIKQAMRGDIPWWQAIGGAAVSTSSKFITAGLDPFYQGALSWARGDTGDERFTIRGADLVEPWKEVSSISMATKWWAAIQTGKWISKNESYVTDISPIQATIMSATGMSPQEQDDMFITNQMIKGETEAQKSALKEFIKDWRRGIQAKENNDDEQGNAYHRNAMARLTTVGYPYEKILSAIAIANRSYERAIDNSNYNSWSHGNRNKSEQRLERYKRQLKLQDEKQ
jgi:hypothetical protein